MIYLQLFWEFVKVGFFCVGGGYASMPLIQASVVDTWHWLSLSEFVDIFTISQMTPGPIGINAATFAGMKVAGIGANFSCASGVLPSDKNLRALADCGRAAGCGLRIPCTTRCAGPPARQ